MSAAITFNNVSVSFAGQTVLHSINAEFFKHSVTVIVGRSGSGKTTLLRTVNRLNDEFAGCTVTGQVYVDFGQGMQPVYGGRTGDTTALRRRVGMLFQTPHLFPVSIRKNISMPLELVAGCPKAKVDGAIRSALEAVSLWDEVADRLDKPAHSLSGGQQQRLCLARVLALEPEVLLLDEPTASLDIHAAGVIEALIPELAKHYTILMVSHSLRQAVALAQQLLVCADGRLVEHFTSMDGVTESVLSGHLLGK